MPKDDNWDGPKTPKKSKYPTTPMDYSKFDPIAGPSFLIPLSTNNGSSSSFTSSYWGSRQNDIDQGRYGGGGGGGGGGRTGGSGYDSGDGVTLDTSLGMIAESLLPYLGNTEHTQIKSWLKYNYDRNPTASPWTNNRIFIQNRATQATDALQKAAVSMGKSPQDLGSGYQFLLDTIDLLKKFGGGEDATGMSRANQAKLSAEFHAMKDSGDYGQYENLADVFTTPTKDGQSYFPTTRVGSSTIYGRANNKLFG